MTTETKIAAQLDDGHYEIEVRIHDKRLSSAPQQPVAVDEAMVERACRHWYTTLWDTADQATKRLWAKTMYDLLTAALSTQHQPAEEGERDWLAEAMDRLSEWRFDALVGGEDGLQTEIEALRAEVERSERYAEQSERERLWVEARAERLADALRLAEEHLNAITPEWYSAGQRVLAEIRAALAKEEGT